MNYSEVARKAPKVPSEPVTSPSESSAPPTMDNGKVPQGSAAAEQTLQSCSDGSTPDANSNYPPPPPIKYNKVPKDGSGLVLPQPDQEQYIPHLNRHDVLDKLKLDKNPLACLCSLQRD